MPPDLDQRIRALPWCTRLHIRGRLRTCPYDAVAAAVPESGLIGSIGCGFGVFEIGLALASRRREILGTDADRRKIATASALAAGWTRIRFEAGDFFSALGDGPRPAAILAIDTFYLIPYADQAAILRKARDVLRARGVMIVKDMRERPRWKAAWNRFQETLAVRVLRITQGERFYFRSSESWERLFTEAGFSFEERCLDRGYIHPHTLFVGAPR
jgi:SAM-dependent methyltransferase